MRHHMDGDLQIACPPARKATPSYVRFDRQANSGGAGGGSGTSGALKHAFDECYCQILDTTRGRPFGVYLHGNEGTERALTGITAGLGWVKAADYVVVMGKPTRADLEACWNLDATVAATLMG